MIGLPTGLTPEQNPSAVGFCYITLAFFIYCEQQTIIRQYPAGVESVSSQIWFCVLASDLNALLNPSEGSWRPVSANARLVAGLAVLAFGVVLLFGSVLVYETAWPPLLKSGVIGFLPLGAEIFAIPAIAIMGKENFARLAAAFKRCIGSLKPAGNIGPVRHAVGIVLLLIPVPVVYIMAYLPLWLPDNSPERMWVNLLADIIFKFVRSRRRFVGQAAITVRQGGAGELSRPT